MANYYKNFTHATLVWSDATPLTHTMDVDDGTVQITDVVPGLRERSDYERKGHHVSSAFVGRKYPKLTISWNMAKFKGATGSGNGTMQDLIFATAANEFSARVSQLSPSGATESKIPLALDLAMTIEGTDFGDAYDHAITLTTCALDSWGFQEGDPNKITSTWTILGAITGDFAASEA